MNYISMKRTNMQGVRFWYKKSKYKQLLYELDNFSKTHFISYRRLRNVAKRNMMLMTRDIRKTAIQNVQADTSVVKSTFRRYSVQKYFQALINYKRFFFIWFKPNVFTYFTICAITQTLSVESITCLVNALPTTRILTIFSIGMSTFWKIHFGIYSWVLYRAFEICCIITMMLLFLHTCMTPPTSPTGTPTICVSTCLTVWPTGKRTVCSKIPRLASCKN